MKVCKAYTEARIAWEKHYAELERRYEEAERAERVPETVASPGKSPQTCCRHARYLASTSLSSK